MTLTSVIVTPNSTPMVPLVIMADQINWHTIPIRVLKDVPEEFSQSKLIDHAVMADYWGGVELFRPANAAGTIHENEITVVTKDCVVEIIDGGSL